MFTILVHSVKRLIREGGKSLSVPFIAFVLIVLINFLGGLKIWLENQFEDTLENFPVIAVVSDISGYNTEELHIEERFINLFTDPDVNFSLSEHTGELSMKKTIHDIRKKIQDTGKDYEEPLSRIRKRQEIRTAAEIDRIGISPKALGRGYLIDAVMFRIEGKSNHVVLEVARKYGKTEASVERAMQNAINKAWNTIYPEDLLKYYTAHIRSDKGVPTVMEFICHYADRIKFEYTNLLNHDRK